MFVDREGAPDALGPHDLEAYRIGQTHAVVAKTAEPTIDRCALEIAIDEDDVMRLVVAEAIVVKLDRRREAPQTRNVIRATWVARFA